MSNTNRNTMYYFNQLAIKKGFKSDKQRKMIYMVLKKRREMKLGE